ncbi:hypothetical protein M2277_002840 [Paenibacillus sp. LBL]|nr:MULTISPECIES: hypothetical protein [Paenibacillus]MDH6672178.1 hypothetical protein [Paenibacillus sp. LBL]
MMTYNRTGLWCVTLAILLLTGCANGPRSETIIIPSKEENHTVDEERRPFQVKTIYRLPDSITDQGELLGWATPESVIGLFEEASRSEGLSLQFQRLSAPYESVETLQAVGNNAMYHHLSPDGKTISGVAKSAEGASLKLITYPSGEEEMVEATTDSTQQLLFEQPTWSADSQYVSYLVMEEGRRLASIGVYDTQAEKAKVYRLKGFDMAGIPIKAKISDDGRMMLIVLDQSSNGRIVAMGTINGSVIEFQYEHEIGSDQIDWLNHDQFVFQGMEGTLYEYDRRNQELSILLERADSFEFSQDRKYIAYSLNGKDTLYAGKLQGKNILHAEPIYHGIIPSDMYWSPDHNRLLVNGRKTYVKPRVVKEAKPMDLRPFIIEFE